MIHVTPRARISRDNAGDPLDGLVNMFDIGIVLAVAFLLAALSSLGLEGAVSDKGLVKPALGEVTTKPGEEVKPVPANGTKTVGRGTPVGTVYRLADGRLVYVTQDAAGGETPTPSPSDTTPTVPTPSTPTVPTPSFPTTPTPSP
ncbi:DUF2149 domain-containing protein [Aeromicrobium sp. Root344]|uniref:DUF2149 domain-containing protein n=1 Tax=Aeromicrobium sp. Root344 TaxID=1736521 RepID=UPI0009E814F8|nr:DUF2149 domain-containing protein [Aeromicrobium sp. Root344]